METVDNPYNLPNVRMPCWDKEGYCYLYVGVTEHGLKLMAECSDDEEVKNVLAGWDPLLEQEEVVDVTMVKDGEIYPYTAVVKVKGGRLALIHFLEEHIDHDIAYTSDLATHFHHAYCSCGKSIHVSCEALAQHNPLTLPKHDS